MTRFLAAAAGEARLKKRLAREPEQLETGGLIFYFSFYQFQKN